MSDNKPVISDEAVEAAAKYLGERFFWNSPLLNEVAREVLDAAAPYMTSSAEAAWLEGYKAGVKDADRDHKLREAGGFLRYDELEPNPYRSQV